MTDEELRTLLKTYTNMTDWEISRHIKDGIEFYTDDEAGFEEFKTNWVGCFNDEDDAEDVWNDFDVMGGYRLSFAL